eukprot:CAMPEP_0183408488 /NCGR_PEP_ID=MMETSP0370-20130417/18133_1 /TAXON_ID=268820 /ORGANISM="Peridinium aciculiferum, Strain PAER-2" /LENGTH=75 /DNA_ID=CAMNT_0025591015 /DNA_START=121 /DNA_END=348 /DNA_ORIENTATION=-
MGTRPEAQPRPQQLPTMPPESSTLRSLTQEAQGRPLPARTSTCLWWSSAQLAELCPHPRTEHNGDHIPELRPRFL